MDIEQMTNEKVTFTLRIPENKNESIKKLSEKIGISQNSMILLFIEFGLSFEETILHKKEEFLRFLSQNQK